LPGFVIQVLYIDQQVDYATELPSILGILSIN